VRAWWLGALALVLACRDETAITTSAASTTSSGSGGSGGSGGAAPEGPPVLLTWNLELFPLTAEADDRVIETLADLRPDVVVAQDIADPAAFQALGDSAAGYDALLNDDPGAFQRVGMLYREDRVTVSAIETLFTNNSYAFPRPPLKARVRVGALDTWIVVVHLKAQLDADSVARRRAACQLLDDWMRQNVMNGHEDIVVAGDFNDELTDPPEWNVFGPFLDDPAFYTFLTLPEEESGDFTYIPFRSMIDHVLVTSSVLDEYGAGTTEVLPLEATIADYRDTVSDHRPVQVVFDGGPLGD
jgi:endonuclease/exonuclease/phosphatase family metal-dependent hydrolase